MTRPTIIAAGAALALLAGCHDRTPAPPVTNEALATDNVAIEDVPADGLGAPAGDAPDRESGDGGGNEGTDVGRNAM